MSLFSSLFSPLKEIQEDPDELAAAAYKHLREAERRYGNAADVVAEAQMATAKLALATYLRSYGG